MHRRVLTPEQWEARAANALAQFFMQKLIVPKVFFAAPWPSSRNRIDVLAVDRAGAGDVHIAEVKEGLPGARDAIKKLMGLPGHYKYIAFLGPGQGRIPERDLYAPDGFGRIGTIWISEEDRTLRAKLDIPPERFRLQPSYIKSLDKFVDVHTADLEVRP